MSILGGVIFCIGYAVLLACTIVGTLWLMNRRKAMTDEPDRHRSFVQALVTTRSVCPVCSYLWSECECGVGASEASEEYAARYAAGLRAAGIEGKRP